MRKRHILKLFFITTVVLVSTQVFGANNATINNFVEGNTKFCFDLYKNLNKTEGNLFISPHSISTAVGMLYAGAKGKTKDEISSTLHFNPNQEVFFSGLKDINSRLNSLSDDGSVQLFIANSLWAQKGNNFLSSYLELTDKYFDSELKSVDFINNTHNAVSSINKWVRNKTNNKIKEALKPETLSALTELLLCNAIYFKGQWLSQFDENETKESSFYLGPWKRINVPMMNQTNEFRYKDFKDFSAVQLPYVTGKKSYRSGNNLSMIIFLPESKKGLPKLENLLDQQNITQWIDELMNESVSLVKVRLPKFTTESGFELSKMLTDMGMPSAFNKDADLSGIFDKKDIFTNRIIHKTFLEINEEGTEAAAVTIVEEFTLGGGPSFPPKIIKFYADHPFIFLIIDNQSRNILFIGRIADPSK
jgi:serpin B